MKTSFLGFMPSCSINYWWQGRSIFAKHRTTVFANPMSLNGEKSFLRHFADAELCRNLVYLIVLYVFHTSNTAGKDKSWGMVDTIVGTDRTSGLIREFLISPFAFGEPFEARFTSKTWIRAEAYGLQECRSRIQGEFIYSCGWKCQNVYYPD